MKTVKQTPLRTKKSSRRTQEESPGDAEMADRVETFKMYYNDRHPLVEIKIKAGRVVSAAAWYPDGQVLSSLQENGDGGMYVGEEYHDSGQLFYTGDYFQGTRYGHGTQFDLQGKFFSLRNHKIV
jgi:antitoxin component YwqK of YwqJK toxin-antitoxin module